MVSRTRFSYLMIAPTIVLMVVLLVGPLLYSLFLSFNSWQVTTGVPLHFVGLENYVYILSGSQFWHSLRITLLYTVAVVTLEFILGLGLALLLDRDGWGISALRAILILPMMVTPVVSGLIWGLMFDARYGIINYFLGHHILWTGTPTPAMIAAIVIGLWLGTPFVMVLLLAALRSLPSEPFEAAAIDGGSQLQIFRYITLPLLAPTILITLLIRTIFEFRAFDQIWILTQGGPADQTLFLSLLTYRVNFVQFDLGSGATLSWLMLIVTGAICAVYIKVLYHPADVG